MALKVTDAGDSIRFSDGVTTVVINKNPWGLSWIRDDGSAIVNDARRGEKDPVKNPQYQAMMKPDGLHKAYPGLPTESFLPLAYYTGNDWQSVASLTSYSLSGKTLVIQAATTDQAGAEVRLTLAPDGALELGFTPRAKAMAVEAAFDAPASQGYFGAGQRFEGYNQRGRSVPLWISHGGGSDRYDGTNEIAAPFFWSQAGWGLWSNTDARGEIDFADKTKRGDAVGDAAVEVVLQARAGVGGAEVDHLAVAERDLEQHLALVEHHMALAFQRVHAQGDGLQAFAAELGAVTVDLLLRLPHHHLGDGADVGGVGGVVVRVDGDLLVGGLRIAHRDLAAHLERLDQVLADRVFAGLEALAAAAAQQQNRQQRCEQGTHRVSPDYGGGATVPASRRPDHSIPPSPIWPDCAAGPRRCP